MGRKLKSIYPPKGSEEYNILLEEAKRRRESFVPGMSNELDNFEVPDVVLMDAVEETAKKYNRALDKWKTEQRRYCKGLCIGYGHVDEDLLAIRGTDIRKMGRKKKNRSGPDDYLERFVAAYPKSSTHSQQWTDRISKPDYPYLVVVVDAKSGGNCVCCGELIESHHHNMYVRMETPDEVKDVAGVCNSCHPVVDALRRRREMKKEKNNRTKKDECTASSKRLDSKTSEEILGQINGSM